MQSPVQEDLCRGSVTGEVLVTMKYRPLVLLVFLMLLSSCGSDDQIAEANFGSGGAGRFDRGGELDAISVRAFRADQRPISTYIVSNTTLESIRKVSIFARLNALVDEILVEEGDTVRAGQVMARLDDREIRNEFEQAQIEIQQAEVAVEQAEVKAQLSATNYERAIALYEQKLTSKQEFDQAALTNRTDELAFKNAQRQLEAARARLAAAQLQLEYSEIESSISGVVTARMIEEGDRVNANQEVFSVEEFPPLWARIFVPERSLPRLQVGQIANIRIETFPGREFQARIKMISPTVDVASGTVKVTLELTRPGPLLKPGMFGTVYIATETRPNAVVIPKRAIVRERDRNYVFVVGDDNLAQKREVEAGFSEEEWIEITGGVEAGEAVVTVGHETLSDGYAVNILGWENSKETLRRAQAAAVPAEPDSSQALATARPVPVEPGRSGAQRGAGPMSPERLEQVFERMMQNSQFKKAWEERLKEDPAVADDFEEKQSFLREMFQKLRGNRGDQ